MHRMYRHEQFLEVEVAGAAVSCIGIEAVSETNGRLPQALSSCSQLQHQKSSRRTDAVPATAIRSLSPSVGLGDRSGWPLIHTGNRSDGVFGHHAKGAVYLARNRANDREYLAPVSPVKIRRRRYGRLSEAKMLTTMATVAISETGNNLTVDLLPGSRGYPGQAHSLKPSKLAALCAAKKSFSAEKLTLQKVKLSASKFSKYAHIGRDRRFDEIRDQLPKKAGYSVLYAMSQLSDEQWQRGFDEGIINPRSSRSDIDAFRTGSLELKAARIQSVPFFAAVTIPPEGPRPRQSKVSCSLHFSL